MQLVKVVKHTSSKIEQAKLLLKLFCVLSDIKLSDSELTVLAFFVVYGINDETKDLIVKSEILKGNSIKNTMSKLSNSGLIKKAVGSKKEYYVTEKINVKPEPSVGMLIKINN